LIFGSYPLIRVIVDLYFVKVEISLSVTGRHLVKPVSPAQVKLEAAEF
jgi:hypothetical protein